ncbi:Non-ribosomal peptide synthase, involved in Hassallidin biosynthesis [Planktothrix serta PCC 8927]|uniref:Non-ribosomal peptide synthase, involved in Hassallidin biosynthesis n=1 Tax=Planktothrix serta PCC 8927 TaxID=671068 RepID=A0A1J1JM69_9CYAN|nr:non-ribosomal peptide synthetase [Planktothrix serta]CZT62785.1 Non-ribosomal peptide synthase, involved in Hassallidin biosynthesis [Planktothrix serta PCC 8927]VXD10550.1 Non-ribosomal peptide synthase, involved in Hassallidin biosynthesis [Planktothrix serta PCC 8927]
MEVYVLPLSLAQRQIWFNEILSPGNIAYNIPIALKLVGDLHQEALKQSFHQIIYRHEVLRTTFAIEDGEPVQLIHPEGGFELEEKSLEFSLDDQPDQLKTILERESQSPFNLVNDFLIRGVLYRISNQDHILLVNLHHIISDGWSLGILVQELAEFYRAYLQGSSVSLPELPIQYGDYAEWQVTWLKSQTIQEQITYWKKTLTTPLPNLELLLDKKRPPLQTFHGTVWRQVLPVSLTSSLEAFAKANNATFFMVTLAAYYVLLYRYTGQSDIIVGTVSANRQHSEITTLIGCFVNALPLRADLSGRPTFRQLLQQISLTCVAALANQDVPLELIVEELEIQRNPQRSPIFQTLFALQNAPLGEIQLPGIIATPIYIDNGGAKFDLSLMLEPSGSGWQVALEYNTDLFTAPTAQRLLTHYQHLLTAVLIDPDVDINILPILTHSDRQELLTLGSGQETTQEQATNLVELFTHSAHKHANQIAISTTDQEITYQELHQQASQLAAVLQQKGIGIETRVGIYLERSTNLIIALLAVLLSGGTYVPLDPQYPSERLRFIAEDSGITLLLTTESLLSHLPIQDRKILVIDQLEPTQEFTLTTQILPQQAAYIIYTSGSTGQPKGCVITHNNVVRLMRKTDDWFGFNEKDVWTLFHSFAFDFSVWEIWGALLYGGKLVIVQYLESRSPEAFRNLLQRQGVTILNQTPSAFRQLMRADQAFPDKLGLRVIIFGGEALELQSLKPWIERYGDNYPRLINMYGITETTVHVTYRQITAEDIDQNPGSVIGLTIPDLSLHILDDTLEPTPIGVRGEIYVGGMGLSRGYINQPTLTATKFIPDPYSLEPGARLYRTGDLARRLASGDIEYLGRSDLQVKIRGFRIELGEIEAALTAFPEVAEAIVIAHTVTTEDKRLVAYIVTNRQMTAEQLRTTLKEQLPDYMLPQAFMFLDTMPLTAQGKIDRQALPIPDWHQSAARQSFLPPQTEAEKVICAVWTKVLEVDGIGVEDNFFDLGGDSILALKVVAEIRRQGWLLTPKEIFQEQTVKRLGVVVERVHSLTIPARTAEGSVLLTPIQKWFFSLNVANPHHWNQALLFEVHQSLEPTTIATAIQTVAAHHDTFRLRFAKEEGIWQQFYGRNDANLFAFATLDLSDQDDLMQNAAKSKAVEHLQKSLNLSDGPLAAATYFYLGSNRLPQLLVVIHHLIVDGVSWRILLQDIKEAINGSQLAPVSTSFQQWSEFLQNFANSRHLQAERQFWIDTVKTETATLPLDFPNALMENLEGTVKRISRQLTTEQTQIFLTRANKAYRTQPQELLIAALGKTLNQITQKTTFQIIMEGHGRDELSSDLDITRTLGWFTTLYPFCLELSSQDLTVKNLVRTVKEQVRSVPKCGFGYGLLRYLNPETADDLALESPSQISFNYLGQVRGESGQNRLLNLLNEDVELTRHPEGNCPHIIDVMAIVVEGQLRVDWLYSSQLHQEETVNQWAESFQQNLAEILAHCCEVSKSISEYTPSDFPLVRISQPNLDSLQERFPQLEDVYPLSPLQEGMLFHTILNSEDAVYFEQVAGKITGKLDVEKLNSAWQIVIKRHPSLRSAFIWDGQKEPLQVVNKEVKFDIFQQDWCDFSVAEQEGLREQYLLNDRQNGFVLTAAPLMRFAVFRLDNFTWQWIWSHCHIILDGWSLPIIFKEVLTVYQAACQQTLFSLPPVPPYRHYIQWLLEQNPQSAGEFWQEALDGISTSTRIAWQLPNETESDTYAEVELRLDAQQFAQLQQMAKSCRLTLNTIAQGAWGLCLQKHGAGEDVVFGVTVSGRPSELQDVENMVGLFINTLPMRIRLNPEVTVATWLEKIQQHHTQMREYEYSKLIDIQKEISASAGEPLFDSILVFENYPVDKSLKEQGRDFQVHDIEFYERTNYPLTLGVIPDDGLLLKLNYQTKYLSATAANILLGRLQNIMVNLARYPDRVLGEITGFSAQDAVDMINAGKAKNITSGEFKAAHQLVEAQADLSPDAVALVCDNQEVTYGELEERANQIAAKLIEAGVGYETIVGLYFHPSIAYIIALLAVLKAGAAFLPLESSYPEARLQFIVEDSKTPVILTSENLSPGLFSDKVKVITFSKEPEKPTPHSTKRLNKKISSENLAYVIYTSGSTGKPKGVLVTHAGIQNLVKSQALSFGVTAESRVYQFASLNFDAAISEIFMALGSGATLYLQKNNNAVSSALWANLTKWQVTHLTLPPSLLAIVEPSELPELSSLIVAGEAATSEVFQRWGKRSARVFNAYGPTEATVCASIMNCSNLLGEPSIGKAIANVEIYLLDSFLQPVAPGVIGEIYIGGISLARGYLSRPELTGEAFIPHPFATKPGARLYRTGDRGTYDSQGNICFIGRKDSQIKLNGYRIELGEIEATLIKHPTVDSAVVMLRQDVPGRKRLVAYACITKDSPATNELRDYLVQKLPAYMVPSTIVPLKQWPLTPNGKIDRTALPTPELTTFAATPKTATEEIFAQIWVEVLGLETVHPQDNFFELGGDSIMSLQVVSRARTAGWEINPKDIFEAQTLSRIAARAKPLSQQIEVTEPLTGVVPLSPIQHWFFAQNLLHPHHWNQAVALSIDEPLNIDAFSRTLDAIAFHHDVLRLKFSQNQGKWEQSYSGAATRPALRVLDFSNLPEDALTAAVETEHESIQLEQSPLFRILYAKNLAKYGNVLFFLAHHLIVDGVSWRILLADLSQAYQQAINDLPISLPLKTSSYRQWTTSLTTLANSKEIIEDFPFWQNILSTPVAILPVDYPLLPNTNTVDSQAVRSCQLTTQETNTLVKVAIATYHASVQEIMLAALLKTLYEVYQLEPWLIDLEGHGREELHDQLDISRTVGWFTSIYPILLKKPADSDQYSLLKEIKTQLRTIPHHGISFGLLHYLNQEKNLQQIANNQKASISFNYLGQIDNLTKNHYPFKMSHAPTGTGLFGKQERSHLLAINARIQNEYLQVDWSYSQQIHHPQTINRLAEVYLNNLRLYLTDSPATDSSFYSATDFQLVNLSESELNSLLEDLE